ncbi:vanadium-dependent haloperoxidase [Siphonobacter curvatus]|uniref:Haloperoxidase n=2 Tax=Siphonobacter TaxID=700450 RepID=A0A2S7IFS0_9BACT|nr:vanadium-dependent haloperoxidase [Siphonobacter curvatus]PQA54072.1 haloperoxidase [Siphonobacter curvatus]
MKYWFILCFLVGWSCTKKKEAELAPAQITHVIEEMTETMIHDVTNPPLAARFFSYACLSGYEVLAQHDSSMRSMHGVLNGFPVIQKPSEIPEHSVSLTALLAMMETAQKMQPSGKRLAQYETHFLDSCRTAGYSDEVLNGSKAYAQAISKQILAYAKADRYNRISNYPRYQTRTGDGFWYPTPPGYFAPVEPYFATVRSFTLDTCSQFKPAPPTPYSADPKSAFYRMMQINYADKLPDEHKQIAAFWDCNPFALEDNGHLMVGMKKISPGAHWLGITGIACQKAKVSFAQALKIHTVVAITLTDGFICCWDEKYRSNRIRPETAIRKLIDPHWRPFLQTPPFPEYLSGHSTISSAAAVVLTHYFGDHFAYTDTVEEPFGLKARPYQSFQQAADEAGMSRLYGGIHFMDAITEGRQQGLKVGTWVIQRVEGKRGLVASN